MYKLQIINALTHEIIREKTYIKPDFISGILTSARKGLIYFLFDEDSRAYIGEFTGHSVSEEKDSMVFKLDFNLKV